MRAYLKKTVFAILAIFLALCVFEGLLSFFFMFRSWHKAPDMAEKKHVRHDPDLGWSHIPDIEIKDMYGKGRHLTINRQGLRSLKEYDKEAPKGKTRILCLGDSFTLGFGVSDDQTFPHYMEEKNPAVEVVNMGQGGFGLGQMLLWYRRDCGLLSHDILVLGFVDYDLFRMNWNAFLGYEKPYFKLENQNLNIHNFPVPKSSFTLRRRVDALFKDSNILKLVKLFVDEVSSETSPRMVISSEQEFMATVLAVFEGIRAYAAQEGVPLVVFRLPIYSPEEFQEVGRFEDILKKRDFVYFDLLTQTKDIPPQMREKVFITKENADKDLSGYMRFEGHYTRFGNEFVAGLIMEKLVKNGFVNQGPPQ